jgi:hypothetical protein
MIKPNLTLNGIEFLLVCMQSNPGMSQRYYLRRKFLYLHSMSDPHKGGSGAGYFRSPSYRDFVWTDASPQNVWYYCSTPVDGFVRKNGYQSGGTKSKSAQMHLTRHGWTRANEARKKLGLEPLPYNDGTQVVH